jgi:hypothetical protein
MQAPVKPPAPPVPVAPHQSQPHPASPTHLASGKPPAPPVPKAPTAAGAKPAPVVDKLAILEARIKKAFNHVGVDFNQF